jgi:hypothetical protein
MSEHLVRTAEKQGALLVGVINAALADKDLTLTSSKGGRQESDHTTATNGADRPFWGCTHIRLDWPDLTMQRVQERHEGIEKNGESSFQPGITD